MDCWTLIYGAHSASAHCKVHKYIKSDFVKYRVSVDYMQCAAKAGSEGRRSRKSGGRRL